MKTTVPHHQASHTRQPMTVVGRGYAAEPSRWYEKKAAKARLSRERQSHLGRQSRSRGDTLFSQVLAAFKDTPEHVVCVVTASSRRTFLTPFVTATCSDWPHAHNVALTRAVAALTRVYYIRG